MSNLYTLFLVLVLGVLSLTTAANPLALAAAPNQAQIQAQEAEQRLDWAYRYQHAEGVKRDLPFALQLFCELAWEGNAEAAYELGWIYLNGRGLPDNPPLAKRWISLAAELGDPLAARTLGQLRSIEEQANADCQLPDGRFTHHQWLAARSPRQQVREWVKHLAPRYQLRPALVMAVIETESGFNAKAVSRAGAQGLMQLMPATADRFQVEDPFDPLENIKGGMRYLDWLIRHFDGDLEMALAGYNAGENAVKRYDGIPPYRETQDYVGKVLQRYARYQGQPG